MSLTTSLTLFLLTSPLATIDRVIFKNPDIFSVCKNKNCSKYDKIHILKSYRPNKIKFSKIF